MERSERAARAEPRLSACLIVRDEEAFLPACLSSLAGWVDELCVLDTGSQDATVRIAEEAGARVAHFAWCGDFAAARNAALELASGDWVLSIDADERLAPESGNALRAAARARDRAAWLVRLENVDGTGEHHAVLLPRLFRRDPAIRFARPVHESILESWRALAARERGPLEPSGVRIVHEGYRPEVLLARDKHARNLAILVEAAARAPEDAYLQYKLAGTLRGAGRAGEARAAFERALASLAALAEGERALVPFAALAAAAAARARHEAGEVAAAAEAARLARAWTQGSLSADLLAVEAELCLAKGDAAGAGELFEACLATPAEALLASGDPGWRGAKARLGAARAALARGADARVAAQLSSLTAERARDPAVGALAVRAQVAAGEVEAGLAELGGWLERAPAAPDVLDLAGEIAWMQGDLDTACALWRQAQAEPASGGAAQAGVRMRARARLVHGLLALARFDEAEDLAARLAGIDLDCAAIARIAALVGGREPRGDLGLPADPLMDVFARRVVELLDNGGAAAARRLAEGAAAHAGLGEVIARAIQSATARDSAAP